MKILKELNFENISREEQKNYKIRNAVRAVIFDEDKNIGIMNVSNHNFYKLPGGGIEGGETKDEALKRECMEEAGVEIEITSELGKIIEVKSMHKMIQNSFCYIAKVKGKKGMNKLTEKESLEGFVVEWMTLEDAIKKIKNGGYSYAHGRYVFERELLILEEARK